MAGEGVPSRVGGGGWRRDGVVCHRARPPPQPLLRVWWAGCAGVAGSRRGLLAPVLAPTFLRATTCGPDPSSRREGVLCLPTHTPRVYPTVGSRWDGEKGAITTSASPPVAPTSHVPAGVYHTCGRAVVHRLSTRPPPLQPLFVYPKKQAHPPNHRQRPKTRRHPTPLPGKGRAKAIYAVVRQRDRSPWPQ